MTAAAAIPSFPTGDTAVRARVKLLPHSAQSKFVHLERVETRARALIDGLLAEQNRVRDRLGNAQAELGFFDRDHPHPLVTRNEDGQRVRMEDPARVAIIERIAELKREVQRLGEEQARAHPGFSTSAIFEWLIDQPADAEFTAAPAPLIRLAKGETLNTTLVSNREAQGKLRDQIATVENAPATASEAKQRMRAEIDRLAAAGTPDIGNLFHEGTGNIGFQMEMLTLNGAGHHPHVSVTQVVAALPLIVWAHRNAITAALEAQIDAQADDAHALSTDARAAALANAQAALLDLQRREEAIAVMIEETGQMVRRVNSVPPVLLGLELTVR